MRAARSAALALAAVVAASGTLSAHRLDECLQAARIAVEPDHLALELDITPGVAVADAIVADVDRDRDGVLSASEQAAYVRLVLDSLDLAIDHRPVDLTSGTATFPDIASLRRGEGTIQLHSTIALPTPPTGAHQVLFRNRYRRDISVYLANALVPESDRIAVTGQRREAAQRDLTIDYRVRAEPAASPAWWLLSVTAGLAALLVRPTRRSLKIPNSR